MIIWTRLTGVLLLGLEETDDLLANLSVGNLDIVLGVTVIGHEGEVVIVGDVELNGQIVRGLAHAPPQGPFWNLTYELVLATGDVGDVHVVGGGAQLLKLLAGEDVNGDQVDLGVTVLASLGGRHVDDLARTALDDNETVLPEGRALHGEGQRRTGVSRVEGVFMLRGAIVSFARREKKAAGVEVCCWDHRQEARRVYRACRTWVCQCGVPSCASHHTSRGGESQNGWLLT